MTYQQLENKAFEIANIVGTSYASALQSMYEVACEQKRYKKAHMILELIHEDIHSTDHLNELAYE